MNYCIFKAVLNIDSNDDLELFINEILDTYNQYYSVTVFSNPDIFEIEGMFISTSNNSVASGLEFENMTKATQKQLMDSLKGNSKVSALFATDLLPLFHDILGFTATFQNLANHYKYIQFNKIPDLLLKELDATVDS